MKTYYFTFMLKQEGLAKHLQPIVAKDESTAREKMFEMYGSNWAFCYDEKPEKYKDAPELTTVYADERSDYND